MSAFNSPFFGVEVVSAIAKVLDLSQGQASEGDGDDSFRCIVGQYQGFAAKILQGLRIR